MSLEALEQRDNFSGLRNALRTIADERGDWAGIPMPIEDSPLIVEPQYPNAAALMAMGRPELAPDEDPKVTRRNVFWSTHRRCDVHIWTDAAGRVEWGIRGGIHHFDIDLATLGASYAWGMEQESNAVQLLATHVRHHIFKQYLLTGMFLEHSERSGVMYVFRRLRPTVALSQRTGRLKILACLCSHPIAYYSGSWAGAMTPTDDVIAHLMLMRGDEKMFWRRSNQHPAHRPEAGL